MILSPPFYKVQPPVGASVDFGKSISQGLVACYLMNQGAGLTLFDLLGNNNGAITLGTGSWGEGRDGKTLSFDKANTLVNCGLKSPLTNIPALTIMTSVFPLSAGENNGGRIADKMGPGNVGWQMTCGTTFVFVVAYDADVTELFLPTTTAPDLNAWNDLCLTWDGSNVVANAHIYKNNIECVYGSTSNGGTTRDSDAAANFIIGNNAGQTRTFEGRMSYLYVWRRVLSQDERTSLFINPYSLFNSPRITSILFKNASSSVNTTVNVSPLTLSASLASAIPSITFSPDPLNLIGSVINPTAINTLLASSLGMVASLQATGVTISKTLSPVTGSFSIQSGSPTVIVLPSGLTATFTLGPLTVSGATDKTVLVQPLTLSATMVGLSSQEVKVSPLSLLVTGSVQGSTKEVKINPNAITLAIATNNLTPQVNALIGPQSLISMLGGTVPNVSINPSPLNISALLVSPAISIAYNTTVFVQPLLLIATLGSLTIINNLKMILASSKNKQPKNTTKSNLIHDVKRNIQLKAVTKHQL